MLSTTLFPFGQNTVKTAICFASDRNYLDYTFVAIQSIIEHASDDYCYDIVILGTDCAGREEPFRSLFSKNVSVRILDMEAYIEKFGMRDFYVSGNIPMASYFRFFIPEIFSEYSKVLYLDGDVLVCDDVKFLLAEDLGDALVGAVRDAGTLALPKKRQAYLEKRLGVSPEKYFCSGIMLYNVEACNAFNFSNRCIAKLEELVAPPYHDQDVLNSVTRGRVKQIPLRWHLITTVLPLVEMNRLSGGADVTAEYQKAIKEPGILHYAGAKPWNEDRIALADLWWKTADATSVGLSLRLRLERKRSNRLEEAVSFMGLPWLFLTYSFYKLVTLFAAGERRKEYKRRAKLLKYIIRHGI